MSNDSFTEYHTRFKETFNKDLFFKFYSAIKNEIMRATDFKPSVDSRKALYDAFKSRNIADYFKAFDLIMRDLFEFSPELYVHLCKYLFQEDSKLSDEEYILLEFYAWLELEKKHNPFGDSVEGKIRFLLDEQYTQCDDAVEEYFNADQESFRTFFEKYADVDIPALYVDLIRATVDAGNFRRAFVYLARALFLAEKVCFYKDRNGRIRDYKLRTGVTTHAETR